MSNVFRRNRGATGLEFMDNASRIMDNLFHELFGDIPINRKEKRKK